MTGPAPGAETRVAGNSNWVESKRAIVSMGLNAPGVASKFRMYDDYLQKMDDALRQHEWLVGDLFSLADISMTPYVNRLDVLGMSDMWTRSRPHLANWFERIKARPAFKPLLSRLLSSRSDERPEDLWLAELAGSPRHAWGDIT